MARGAAKAPYTASSAKPYPNKKSKSKSKRPAADPDAPARPARAQPLAALPEPDDAYTYLPSLPKRHRTSTVQLSLTKDEAIASAGPSRRRLQPGEEEDEEADDMEARIRKLAMQIAEDDPGAVESDESDVDSEMAWEEGGSDDERWGDVFRDMEKGKKGKGGKSAKEVVKKPTKPFTVNLDESDDDLPTKGGEAVTESEDEDDMEDGDEEEDDESDDEDIEEEEEFTGFGSANEEDEEEDLKSFKPSKISAKALAEDEDEDDEMDSEDDDEDDSDIADPDLPSDLSDSDDNADLDDLDAFVDQLASADAKKRKVDFEDDEPVESGKKRRVLPVSSGPAVGDGEQTLRGDGKLDISTLLSSHPSLASARALLPSKSRPVADASKSVLKSGVLSAPLPTVVQERLAREAAYEKTKEEGAKWSGVMKRVREAEHLSFPLQNTGGVERGSLKSGGEMLSTFKPQNEMESAVQRLLDSANLTEKGMTELEDQQLQGQDLSVEEIAARRAELRRQRELMFRAENRAKRVAKIKSKTFRKLARRRAEKDGLSNEDMERLEPGTMEREKEKMELERARERATQRHGAKTKFGRNAMEGDFGNEDKRRAREDMLDLKERLKRRIAGQGDGDDDDSDESEDEGDGGEGDDGEGDDEDIKARAFEQISTLNREDGEGESKGLMGMKFMQKARERDAVRAREAEEEAKRDIMLFGQEGQASDEEEDEAQVLKLGEGRMVFAGPTPTNDTSSSSMLNPTSEQTPHPTSTFNRRSALTAPRSPSPEVNPWLTSTSASTSNPSRKKNQVGLSTAADKAVQSLKKAKGRNGKVDDMIEDERVDIVLDTEAPNVAPPPAPVVARKSVTFAGPNGDKIQGDLMPSKPASTMFKQRDLVAEAFAGDDVVVDFEKEKARQMELDAPKIEDTSLMGWGSWGGKGLKKRKTASRFLLKTAGTEPSTRKDFGQSNVIISERSERKAKQFLPKDLPYPYTSVAQYQASLAQPVGGEWNSRTAVQRETLPRVIKKPGAIIEPVRRLF